MKLIYPTEHKLFEREDTYSLRGICMIMIIINHLYHSLVVHYGIALSGSAINYGIYCAGYSANALFFLLSGYGLNCSLKTNPLNFEYVKKHIQNLLFPYLYAWCINIILTGNFSMGISGWFLKTIFIIYILSFAVYHITKNQWVRLWLISIPILVYIILANTHLGLAPFYTNSIICFPIGIICSTFPLSSQKKGATTIVLLLLFSLFGVLEKNGFAYADYFIAILFSFISIYLASMINVTCKVFDYIGRHSIMFYVLQIALIDPLMKIESPWLYCIGVFVIIYALTYVYYKVKARL